MKRTILYTFVLLILLSAVILMVGCKPTPTPLPPTPTPTATPTPVPTMNKWVVVIRDPKCQGFQFDHISTVNGYPVFVPAVNPGSDNKQFFLYGYRINVFTESNQYPLNQDGALRDKDGYWYYQIRNAEFTSGMNAALYFVRFDHVRDE